MAIPTILGQVGIPEPHQEQVMGKGNDNDRYVEPHPEGGWQVVKEDHQRASAHTDTKKEALDRGREIVRNQGGGELRIADRHGTFIDSDTIKPGHESKTRDTK